MEKRHLPRDTWLRLRELLHGVSFKGLPTRMFATLLCHTVMHMGDTTRLSVVHHDNAFLPDFKTSDVVYHGASPSDLQKWNWFLLAVARLSRISRL